MDESPWNEEGPSYKLVPPLNPKTGEPVSVYLCELCGGAVLNRKVHSKAHSKSALPF